MIHLCGHGNGALSFLFYSLGYLAGLGHDSPGWPQGLGSIVFFFGICDLYSTRLCIHQVLHICTLSFKLTCMIWRLQ